MTRPNWIWKSYTYHGIGPLGSHGTLPERVSLTIETGTSEWVVGFSFSMMSIIRASTRTSRTPSSVGFSFCEIEVSYYRTTKYSKSYLYFVMKNSFAEILRQPCTPQDCRCCVSMLARLHNLVPVRFHTFFGSKSTLFCYYAHFSSTLLNYFVY